jgi:hypothetical protein
MHVRRVFVDTLTDGFSDGSKSLAGFLNFFGAHINKFPTVLPTEFNATDNNKFPSVIPSEILIYKPPRSPFVSFFPLGSVSLLLRFSSPLRFYLAFGRDFIVLVVVLKGMYSFFFIFVFFLF